MRLVKGVSLKGVQPQVLWIYKIVEDVCELVAPDSVLWVTAVSDGKHRVGSLHYAGAAIDLDLVPDPGDTVWVEIMKEIDLAKSDEMDIMFEVNPNHIHGEWQPKR